MNRGRRSMLFGIIGPLSVVVGLAAFAHAGDDNDRRHFKAKLIGYNETPNAISTLGTGSIDLRINKDDTAIDFVLHYEGLTNDTPLFAHIHLGQRHTTGGVSAFFCGGSTKPVCPAQPATVTGTIQAIDIVGPTGQGIAAGELSELIRAIRAGATYANVHTATFPTGEIRGQIGHSHD